MENPKLIKVFINAIITTFDSLNIKFVVQEKSIVVGLWVVDDINSVTMGNLHVLLN